MSLLDNMPHTCEAKIRTRTRGTLGGGKDSFSQVFTGRACWEQQAGAREISEFAKRDIEVTHKVYFAADPGLLVPEEHILIVTNTVSGQTTTLEVSTEPSPDASAGMGVVWKVMAKRTTSGTPGTPSS